MDRVWLKLIAVMVCANVAKYFFMSSLFWVAIDLAALFICYLILRAIPYISLWSSMLYLAGFTLISILVDLGILSGVAGNILSLIVIGWLLWKNKTPRGSRPTLRHKWHK